jgi:uncharacterized protein (DUF488 family)
MSMDRLIFTLGHSTHSIEHFIKLLRLHGVNAVADVRSRPYSRMNPQFSREAFSDVLRKHHIAYSFLGRELGARPEDRSCYVAGRARHDLIARTPLFRSGLDRVADGCQRYRIALVCAEKDPMTCHRALLVCRHLVPLGFSIKHILANGEIEEHDASLRRLAVQINVPLSDLFRSYEDLVEDLYDRRSREIEYVEASLAEERL